MKTTIILLLICCSIQVDAQIGKIRDKFKRKVDKRVEQKIDKTMDKGLDEIEEGPDQESNPNEASDQKENKPAENADLRSWSKYDFVPGDIIIFEDHLEGEELGEFPSRWDLNQGNAEIRSLQDEKVIHFADNTDILPYMEKESWLPEIFTIEFDAFFSNDQDRFVIRLWNTKKGKSRQVTGDLSHINVYAYRAGMGNIGSKYNELRQDNVWRHIALSFNKRSLKVYLDQHRAINIPNVGGMPTGFSIEGDAYGGSSNMMIKNIKIAEGGKKLYDRVMGEGKIVTHGIKFEVNKAEIKSESMGVLNEIAQLLKENPDLKFSIEGHTDSDGEETFNQQLSEHRAEAVKSALVQTGIDATRLSTKGWGESQPLDTNATPEGKANNRRVEFVRL